ncbi:MAG TPA: diaminopimelate epimerase, partial [Planctomycetaceae bacterium]|nr:diaminopimelate epimerase [Planctomycetaceae bacterium]
MKFTKMHGAGNDYVYVNLFEETLPTEAPALARAVSDRHKGIGGDGLVLIEPVENADARMRMFNLDGSEAEMCGNAIRCVAKYLYDHGIARKDKLQIQSGAGLLHLELFPENGTVDRVRVNMGEPILESAKIPTLLTGDPPVNATLTVGGIELQVTGVSMGNPHC